MKSHTYNYYFSADKSNIKHTCHSISVFTDIIRVGDGAVILLYHISSDRRIPSVASHGQYSQVNIQTLEIVRAYDTSTNFA